MIVIFLFPFAAISTSFAINSGYFLAWVLLIPHSGCYYSRTPYDASIDQENYNSNSHPYLNESLGYTRDVHFITHFSLI